ncbi:WD repeat and HMG-box DNA-binding protein 1 [Musca vetustissima]|uniref:WD repeat and HMG-box DNA-binding protein 1 n=1 Tax=Musca vetustissima TaxID=27455 RepID=UPI002AB76402|nr:WD repeat and HMG-box DNA-binding protein 1 [Musca vetustissima]
MYERSSLRYAHTTGYTSLIYTDDGEFILTCGSDGDIRKWRGIDDDDPSSNCLGEFVVCLAQKNDKLLASTDRNTVQAYTFPDMDNDGTLLRFTAPVICMKVRGVYLAAGSEDTKIKVLRDGESQPIDVEGHSGPVLALDIHPNGSHLASVGGEGVLKIWDLLSGGKEIKTIAGLPKANSFENAKFFGTPCFEPCNGYSLIYANGKEIIVLKTSSWETQYTMTDEKIKGSYTCCQFSTDGLFVAAATDMGEISLFDFSNRQSKKCEAPSSECQAITCLAWSTKGNDELAYCDATGQLGTLFSSVGTMAEDTDIVKTAEALENEFGDMEFADEEAKVDGDAFNGDDDEDDENVVSIEKLKNKVMSYASGGSAHDDEETKDSIGDVRSATPSVSGYVMPKMFKQQEPFQPGSTPSHLEHRYLAWNTVGIVTLHTDGADGGAIDVEFHDASVHHSLHIPNYNNHNMASLSSTVLAMASDSSSKIVCIALAASGNKEWSVQLPDCESVEALCASSRMLAVATSSQFLRIFTVMGTQREVVSIPGPVICMAGYEDRILVCYHSAAPGAKQQHLQAMLFQTCGLRLKCQNITMPLTPERQLAWLGFSDCGSPVFSDSMGLVQLFNVKSNCWYPVCDTMKQSSSVSNNYFVISLSERSQILQAVLCRGTSYPMTNPRPMVQELSLQLPLCDLENEKSILEDSMLRASVMSVDSSEKTIKETAIKLFALACRSEMEMRAKELIETIACTDLLMLAVKYATKLGRIHLSDRLSELLPQIEEEQQSREQEEQLVEQSLPASPLILLKAYQNGSASSSNKLAPKSMDLGSAKKSTLKRFAFSNSPTSSLFKKSTNGTNDSLLATPSSEASQENFNGNETESQVSKVSSDDGKSISRTPLNSVNPFASKRKISEVDKTILMGSEKLKMVKK